MSEWPGVDGGGVSAPSMDGTSQQGEIAVLQWWDPLGNGLPVVGAYRAEANDNITWGPGPANYLASLVNLANPGTFDLTEIGGGSVNWAAATGWSGFQALARCLDTNIIPTLDQSWSAFIQYSNRAAGVNTHLFGMWDSVGHTGAFSVENRHNSGQARSRNGSNVTLASNATLNVSGNYGFSALQPYRDGVAEPITINVVPGTTDVSIYIGARNLNGVLANAFRGEVQSFAVYSNTIPLADVQALALLPNGSMHNL